MTKIKKLFALAVPLAFTATFLGVAPSMADNIPEFQVQNNWASVFSDDEVSNLRQNMSDLHISGQTADALLDKMAAGQQLDSTKDVAPVQVKTGVVNGEEATMSIFADGSVSSVSIEEPTLINPGAIAPLSITGCVEYPGAGYFWMKNCKVRTDQVQFSMDFRADVTIGVGGSFQSTITGAYAPTAAVAAGTYVNLRTEIYRPNQSGSLPAEARAAAELSFTGGVGGYTGAVTLHVVHSTLWDTSP